jgi:AraC-like DNA-binding protein
MKTVFSHREGPTRKSARFMKTKRNRRNTITRVDFNMKKIMNINTAIQHIESNLDGFLSLESIADDLGYSPFYIHHLFSETVGLTLYDYIRRRRLTEAAKRLVLSQIPIIEISLQSGYGSQQAFSSAFKSLYKKTPLQFRENRKFYPLQMRFHFNDKEISSVTGKDSGKKIIIAQAEKKDIPGWISMVRLSIDGFPHLDEDEHIKVLKHRIADKNAYILKMNDVIAGLMMISRENSSIDFLGVHPLLRKDRIGRELVLKAKKELSSHREISITTFREGDKADTGHRKEIMNLGFSEAELLFEFGYPTQKMILRTCSHY